MTQHVDHPAHSFVEVPAGSHFPIQNLPFGVFRARGGGEPRVGIAIGEHVLDLAILAEAGLLDGPAMPGRAAYWRHSLNAVMAAGPEACRRTRARVARLLSTEEPALRESGALCAAALRPAGEVELLLPAEVGDYTDFYSSREHATNVGTMFRGKDNALQPNWLHLPVAYHGRSSSLLPSGLDVRRPWGQTRPDDAEGPRHEPSRQLDFELEMGFFIGAGNRLGEPIAADRVREHVFGMVIVNDWRARDLQKWEYVPLGPFLGKNFATSLSPWVVTLDALEPFRCPGPAQDPEPLPYLRTREPWSYDIRLEVHLQSERMAAPVRIAAGSFSTLYWSIAQQLAHHTVNGCNLRTGDLLASGTISGSTPGSRGSMLELAWRGSEPLTLPSGETRAFLADGDRVTMTAWCEGDGYRVGFGEVTARVLPALDQGQSRTFEVPS
jgi:fumarylacetoacetase